MGSIAQYNLVISWELLCKCYLWRIYSYYGINVNFKVIVFKSTSTLRISKASSNNRRRPSCCGSARPVANVVVRYHCLYFHNHRWRRHSASAHTKYVQDGRCVPRVYRKSHFNFSQIFVEIRRSSFEFHIASLCFSLLKMTSICKVPHRKCTWMLYPFGIHHPCAMRLWHAMTAGWLNEQDWK